MILGKMHMHHGGKQRGLIHSYEDYYRQQAGNGISPLWFKESPHQRGHGIGSFLGGLFQTALPLLKKSGIAIGKELLSSGVNVLNDVGDGSTFKGSVNTRLGESANLKRKATDRVVGFLQGKGVKKTTKRRRQTIKQKGKVKTQQSDKTSRRRRSTKQAEYKYDLLSNDIFSTS